MGDLTNVTDGRLTGPDSVSITLHVDGRPVPIRMTFDDVGQLIVALFDLMAGAVAVHPIGAELLPPPQAHGPIRTLDISLREGTTPDVLGLIFHSPGVAIVFELPRAKALALGPALAALSASGRPH
jgi:hypothetical protein